MGSHLQLLERLYLKFVVEAFGELWPNTWQRAEELFGLQHALKALQLSPTSSRRHLRNCGGDARAHAFKRDEARAPFLSENGVNWLLKRLQRIRRAPISLDAKSIVALLLA
jgi:hypothetical protein